MIVLITPTGSRPKQFELCMQWMKVQTYKGKVCWIVIDDCFPVTTSKLDNFKDNWFIVKKYPKPIWKKGDNTQSRNLKVGIDIVKVLPDVEAIFIIEDDDYYKPEYLQEMINRLKGFSLAGETKTVYYNLVSRSFKVNDNTGHSSLFQTCFTKSILPIFESCLTSSFIDIRLFKKVQNANLFEAGKLSIGMKGLPGRTGIGNGHRMKNGISDPDGEKLKELLGDDAKYYLE
jgi:hypothetical protein